VNTTDSARTETAGLVAVALAAGRGDPAALTDLVTRTSAVVWRVCAALVDRGCADDLTQDTYLRAARSLASYRGDSEPLPWLLTIARRVCAEEIARRQRERQATTRLATQRPVPADDAAGRVELLDALHRLPPARREALVLTCVVGLPYADAAAVCGCPVGTIRSRVARARAELANTLWPDPAAGPPSA
jgi:RNA polymerase sigma-70 factor (ECF subfamily)